MSPRLRPLPALLACFLAGMAGTAAGAPDLASPAAPVGAAAGDAVASTGAPSQPGPPGVPAARAPVAPAASAAPVPPLLPPAAVPEAPPDAPTSPVAPASAVADPQAEAETLAAVAPGASGPASPELLAQSVTRGDAVFSRIRRNLGGNVCVPGGTSERWRARYASNPSAFANRLEQILPLLDFVSAEVERAGLPSEFVFIPLVESWYKPDAMNAGGPAGMWQMIGTTAKNHGIHITPGYDGRLSPVESTRAALSYLKVLHGMFGDWEATVMAYNAGEGRIMQAFKRARSRETSGDRRRPHGLSNITYDYVAKLQALSCLVAQPERSGLRLPRGSRFVPLAPVLMEPGVASIEQFASRRGRDADILRRLNPGFKGGRVVAGVPRLVLMPLGRPQDDMARLPVARVSALPETPNLPLVLARRASDVVLPVPDTARMSPVGEPRVADREPLVPAASAPTVVASGDIAGAPVAPGAQAVAVAGAVAPAMHHVVPGDSLWSIAQRYQLSVEDLRALNRLEQRAVVHPGDTLKISP